MRWTTVKLSFLQHQHYGLVLVQQKLEYLERRVPVCMHTNILVESLSKSSPDTRSNRKYTITGPRKSPLLVLNQMLQCMQRHMCFDWLRSSLKPASGLEDWLKSGKQIDLAVEKFQIKEITIVTRKHPFRRLFNRYHRHWWEEALEYPLTFKRRLQRTSELEPKMFPHPVEKWMGEHLRSCKTLPWW